MAESGFKTSLIDSKLMFLTIVRPYNFRADQLHFDSSVLLGGDPEVGRGQGQRQDTNPSL